MDTPSFPPRQGFPVSSYSVTGAREPKHGVTAGKPFAVGLTASALSRVKNLRQLRVLGGWPPTGQRVLGGSG
jgi:hypothetical protein